MGHDDAPKPHILDPESWDEPYPPDDNATAGPQGCIFVTIIFAMAALAVWAYDEARTVDLCTTCLAALGWLL